MEFFFYMKKLEVTELLTIAKTLFLDQDIFWGESGESKGMAMVLCRSPLLSTGEDEESPAARLLYWYLIRKFRRAD